MHAKSPSDEGEEGQRRSQGGGHGGSAPPHPQDFEEKIKGAGLRGMSEREDDENEAI